MADEGRLGAAQKVSAVMRIKSLRLTGHERD
jgi:hypothetical protein